MAKKIKTPLPTAQDYANGAKKSKRPRVKLVSPTIDGLWCRVFVDVIGDNVLYDPNGEPMIPAPPTSGGGGSAEARRAAKEAEAALLASMTDEEKLAYAQKKREERRAAREEREAAKREALLEQLKQEIRDGKIKL